MISHSVVIGWAVVMAGFSTGLYYIGISMGYLYLMMGVIISSAVLPASLTLLWSGQSKLAATLSPPLGLICSLVAWLVTAKNEFGNLSVASTGSNYPMLAGNVVALLSPLVFVPVLTLITGVQRYDWQSMAQIRKADDTTMARNAGVDLELVPGENNTSDQDRKDQEILLRASKIARYLCVFLAISLLVLWPMPMYGSEYVFSKPFFTGWISVGILWLFCGAGCVVLYPVWESRASIKRIVTLVIRELSGKGLPARHVLDAQERVEKESEDDLPEQTIVTKGSKVAT